MDFSKLNRTRVLIGGAAALVLVLSLFFLPWYEFPTNDQRILGGDDYNPDAFICDPKDGGHDCTGFETFPILRWLLLLTAVAPLILAYILVRGHKLSWAPGELTMVAGFTATVLIIYNGIIDKPGKEAAEIGVGTEPGYWLALIATIVIGITGFTRSMESGGRKQRKAPGTV